MESNQNLLSALPNEILLHMIDFLEPKQVNLLMTTSRFFLQLISSEYQLSFPLYSFKDFNITWLNKRFEYWKIIRCSDSPFGRVAALNYVWWLDVRRSFNKVSSGNYKVLGRVRLGKEIGDLDAVNVTISSKTQGARHSVVHLKNKPRRRWFFLPLGEITLESCSDLDVAFFSHTNTYKCRLEMDFMALVKASSSSDDEEIKFMQRYFG